jgi:hypothetical protein
MASIFAKIQDRAERAGIVPYTEKSREWFMQRLRKMSNVTSQRVLADDRLNRMKRPLIGRMFMFLYDPKWKNTLPYYDRFPLILMVGPAEGGFYGLNLHYLSPRNRAVFFDELQSFLNNDKMNETTRFNLAYSTLSRASKLRAFAPCFKHYLYKNVQSHTVEIPPSEWEIALFMPTEDFVGEKNRNIWNKSKTLVSDMNS